MCEENFIQLASKHKQQFSKLKTKHFNNFDCDSEVSIGLYKNVPYFQHITEQNYELQYQLSISHNLL